MDASANLENFVRLSFCPDNPMMHVALAEKDLCANVVENQARSCIETWGSICRL